MGQKFRISNFEFQNHRAKGKRYKVTFRRAVKAREMIKSFERFERFEQRTRNT